MSKVVPTNFDYRFEKGYKFNNNRVVIGVKKNIGAQAETIR